MHIQASAVSWRGRVVLIRGDSGSGKSSLCFSLLQMGWQFVSDDRVKLQVVDGRLMAGPPEKGRGLIECHGIGLLKWPDLCVQPQAVAFQLSLSQQCSERLPQNFSHVEYLGVQTPHFIQPVREACVAAKIHCLMQASESSASVLSALAMPSAPL